MNINSIVFLLCIVASLSFTCDEAGYQDYVKNYYTFKDTLEAEVLENSLKAFIDNCNELNSRKDRGKYAEVTALLDWSDEDLEQIGDLPVKFSGNAAYNMAITPEKDSFTISRNPRIFQELRYNSRKNPLLSTTWATSIVEIAEVAMNNKVKFSPKQLLDCVPEYFDLDKESNGVIPKDLIIYLAEVGLVEKYTHCGNVKNLKRYTFEAELPELPNAGGLMNLLASDKPVFAMIALDLVKLRYVKNMSGKDPISCGYNQPTVYGVVTGYDSIADNPYWEVVTHIVPHEEMLIRIPMSKNTTNASYGGIAAYAFALKPLTKLIDYEDVISVNAEYSFTIEPTFNVLPSCSVTSTPDLPDTLIFKQETCEFEGYVSSAGDYDITVSGQYKGETYEDSFTLKVQGCDGQVTKVFMYYQENADEIGYTIKNVDSNEVIHAVASGPENNKHYIFDLCLPYNSLFEIVMEGSRIWAGEARLEIRAMLSSSTFETVIQTRYNSYLDVPSVYRFSTYYAVEPNSSWLYKMGGGIADLKLDDTTGFTEGDYPTASNKIQLYRKTFNIASVDGFSGVSISVKYAFGLVIYLNGEEAFRRGITGDETSGFTGVARTTDSEYSQVTLPLKTLSGFEYVKEGSNSIGIGLIGVDETQPVTFDCAVRLMYDDDISRYWSIGADFSGFANTFNPLKYKGTDFINNDSVLTSQKGVDNSITITFNNDIHEWISSFGITLHQQQFTQQPTDVIVEVKTSEGWKRLKTVENMYWISGSKYKRIWLDNDKAYNQYRFINFHSGGEACMFTALFIYNDDFNRVVPDLTYSITGALTFFKGNAITDIYPNYEYYTDFTINPSLPKGLILDKYTGIIAGTPVEDAASKSYTIEAKQFNSEDTKKQYVIEMLVIGCANGKSTVTLATYFDDLEKLKNYSWSVYRGTDTTGESEESSSFGTVEEQYNYFDMCLDHDIYTLVVQAPEGNPYDYRKAGFYLAVDESEFRFDHWSIQYYSNDGQPYEYTVAFSSYLPFQIGYKNDWKYLKGSAFDSLSWTGTSFDSEWSTAEFSSKLGNFESVTTYITKSFTIPSSSYHVLNIRMKYKGGVVAYFNGNKVARFNLTDTFDASTPAGTSDASTTAEDDLTTDTFSIFHVILSANQATTDNQTPNKIAFEIHAVSSEESVYKSTPIVFDATGVFGVNECSLALDSVASGSVSKFGNPGYTCTEKSIDNYFDLAVETYCAISKNPTLAYLKWSVENLEGTQFNSFAYFLKNAPPANHNFYHVNNGVETAISIKDSETGSEMKRYTMKFDNDISTKYREVKWTFDYSGSNSPQFLYVSLQYCKPSSE